MSEWEKVEEAKEMAKDVVRQEFGPLYGLLQYWEVKHLRLETHSAWVFLMDTQYSGKHGAIISCIGDQLVTDGVF